ncbi:DNA mismatch repair endonuclease MutL [Thermoflavimicrobium daqui]|jgi:DNA mismatch repair protein MutL|uniref:DNA mismatch repair protein MutL n=1 Tax=Thermoflavimicrobium daqui TaxID=2137476 RepID=A0A364K2G4_9BACL|nr:DNA mismatch repair endonuclease MutL [Thermoflavimicrobium daqui]RAL22531.1 DNA mismatch repair endonuclease MutL [Thermoflavimicrobium daqui]
MGNIAILDDHVANQIAAGEVVERPASIVKELVENAIDAHATQITIQLEEGGISRIRVTDNGVGMEPEDAKLAFARHATSKLKKERDLFAIRTLGFRGEALPSIASVARVTLTTSHDPSQLATSIQMEGGEEKSVESTSRPRGTDVVVTDLFYNTPARLKYLKTVNTEVGHVADVVGRMALAHPHISFTLSHQQRELFRTSGDGKLLHVLYALYGKQVASKMMPIQIDNMDFGIKGFFSKPEITRASRSYITLILNGRFVRSIPITQSILHAYGTLLPSGRYPIGALHIEMDPKLVDVNVHPAKLEVRLSKEKDCCELIQRGLQETFVKQTFVPQATSPWERKNEKTVTVQERLDLAAPVPKKMNQMTSLHNESAYIQKSPATQEIREASVQIKKELQEKTVDDSAIIEAKQSKVVKEPSSSWFEMSIDQELVRAKEKVSDLNRLPDIMPLAQVHGTYIVAQAEDGFYLLDQHAAHERIYYERFSQKLGEKNHRQQSLLIPITMECTASEAKILEAYQSYLRDWGVEIEHFGGTTFIIRSYPHWFPKESEEEIIYEIIEWLKENGKVDTARLRDESAKMMACKAAIKANRHLRQDEMEHLLMELKGCHNPFTCPHGRPIFVHFSTYELEKMFKRVM